MGEVSPKRRAHPQSLIGIEEPLYIASWKPPRAQRAPQGSPKNFFGGENRNLQKEGAKKILDAPKSKGESKNFKGGYIIYPQGHPL